MRLNEFVFSTYLNGDSYMFGKSEDDSFFFNFDIICYLAIYFAIYHVLCSTCIYK